MASLNNAAQGLPAPSQPPANFSQTALDELAGVFVNSFATWQNAFNIVHTRSTVQQSMTEIDKIVDTIAYYLNINVQSLEEDDSVDDLGDYAVDEDCDFIDDDDFY